MAARSVFFFSFLFFFFFLSSFVIVSRVRARLFTIPFGITGRLRSVIVSLSGHTVFSCFLFMANNADQGQTPHSAASDLSLHCLSRHYCTKNRHGDSVGTASALCRGGGGCGFNPRPSNTKDFKKGTNCSFAWRSALRKQS